MKFDMEAYSKEGAYLRGGGLLIEKVCTIHGGLFETVCFYACYIMIG